jgi:hypothetical protein
MVGKLINELHFFLEIIIPSATVLRTNIKHQEAPIKLKVEAIKDL